MSKPRASVTRFVSAVVRGELAGGASESDVAQRVVARLHQELGKLVGSTGFDVMLARALVLARRAHPVLAGVGVAPGGKLEGLDGAPHDGDALRAGAIAVVAQFIELLVVLVGDDLAMRLVRNGWPHVVEEVEK